MASKNKLLFFVLLLCTFSLLFVSSAKAANIMLISEKTNVNIDEEINVYVKIDTGAESVNAVQGKLNIPANIFEVTKVDTTNSIFNFWVEEPQFSGTDGVVSFITGTSKGVSGQALEVLRLTLKARGTGSGEITLSDAVVTASDGKGTNILSGITGTTINVSSETIIPSAPTSAPEATTPVVKPQIVNRPAVLAKNAPISPIVTVPLYPDPAKWYNHLGETIVLWEVPDDITAAAVVMNKNPNTVLTVAEKELSTGKNFGAITEGIWYVHVRFKNNIGWGSTAHFKISLDTTPPLPFEVKIDTEVSDNPSPQITFITQDEFSGISQALIFVDAKEVASSTSATVTLPAQGPGTHTLLVKIFDQAGSSVEDTLQFEILPLPTPSIEFIPSLVSKGELLFVSGTAIPNAFIDVSILNKLQQEVFKNTVQSDNSGNWKIAVDKVLLSGRHSFSAIARDERGALSNPTPEKFFSIRPKIIVSLGSFINLGWLEIFIIFMLVLIAGVSLFAWHYISKKNTREAYKIIIGRDIEKITMTLSESLLELENSEKLPEPSRSTSIAEHIERMKATIIKIKKYIIDQEINKLK